MSSKTVAFILGKEVDEHGNVNGPGAMCYKLQSGMRKPGVVSS
jgi:hypothetical protein